MACVSSKVHRAEVSSREQCEAREKVLVQEVLERRKEAAELIKQVGELNRTIGSRETELRDLKVELTARTQQMGESSAQLVTEKANMERELTAKTAALAQREATLQGIAAAQKSRKNILQDLKNTLSKSYGNASGVTVEVADETVRLTLPDLIFDAKTGTAITADGRNLLQPLANLLTTRPELDVEIQAYTDNAVPKGAKNLDDTWDWSLVRATNVVRVLIREFNVNANQLTPIGKGEFYPLTSNETAEGRQKNRRTVLVLYATLPNIPAVD